MKLNQPIVVAVPKCFILLFFVLSYVLLLPSYLFCSQDWSAETDPAVQRISESLESHLKGGDSSLIFVSPFRNLEPRGLVGVEELLRNSLIHSIKSNTEIRLVERKEIDKVLDEKSFVLSGLVKSTVADEVGRIYGAGGYITGEVVVLPNTVLLMTRLVEIETGEVLWADEERIGIKHELGIHDSGIKHMIWIMALCNIADEATQELVDKLTVSGKSKKAIVGLMVNNSSSEYYGFENQVTMKIANNLVKNGVRVLERSNMETLFEEMKFAVLGDLEGEAKTGELLGADHLLAGDISIFDDGEPYSVFGDRQKVKVSASIRLRIVSIQSGEILDTVEKSGVLFF